MKLHETTANLDGLDVLVQYEYTPGEREEGPESRAAGPGYRGNVSLIAVNVCNDKGFGGMVDASYFSADWVAEVEELILMECEE
jgi:hypothetical protein